MTDAHRILNAATITEADAEALLAAYPGIGEVLAGIAAKREQTHRGVQIRPFTAADLVKNWSGALNHVMVGVVFYEATGMSQFGRHAVYIEKRTGQMTTQTW